MNKITSGAPRPVDEDTEMSDASAPKKKTSNKIKISLGHGKINGSSPTGSRAASPLPGRAGSVATSRAGSPHVGNATTANKSMDNISSTIYISSVIDTLTGHFIAFPSCMHISMAHRMEPTKVVKVVLRLLQLQPLGDLWDILTPYSHDLRVQRLWPLLAMAWEKSELELALKLYSSFHLQPEGPTFDTILRARTEMWNLYAALWQKTSPLLCEIPKLHQSLSSQFSSPVPPFRSLLTFNILESPAFPFDLSKTQSTFSSYSSTNYLIKHHTNIFFSSSSSRNSEA